jgi:hypothetical protein
MSTFLVHDTFLKWQRIFSLLHRVFLFSNKTYSGLDYMINMACIL